MIKIIKESETPEPLMRHLLSWQMTLSDAVNSQPFTGINWQGQDKNMLAHNSKEAYISWFCASPPHNEPYRDENFYTRELTMLSSFVKPDNIVEMGTNLGMGTRLLSYLNPQAVIVTIDNKKTHKHEGNKEYPTGYLIQNQNYIIKRCMDSWSYYLPGLINLCFIDADHTAASVKKDSETAWENRLITKPWGIIWHDYNLEKEELQGYCRDIEEFLDEKGLTGYCFVDGATLWTYGVGGGNDL